LRAPTRGCDAEAARAGCAGRAAGRTATDRGPVARTAAGGRGRRGSRTRSGHRRSGPVRARTTSCPTTNRLGVLPLSPPPTVPGTRHWGAASRNLTAPGRQTAPSVRQLSRLPWSSARRSGVRTVPARSTRRAISYPMRPMSASGCASTASDEPSEMDMMKRNPRSISTTVWFTLPPSKSREAPAVRDVRPEATAASWSARSRGKPSDIARRSPSAETTTVWDTPGVLSTKLVINQFRFCAAWLIGLTLTLLVVGAVRTEALAVRFTACVAAPLDTAPQVALPAPGVLRGAGDLGASLGSGFGGARDQVGLGHPPRQTRGGHSARLGLPQLRGLLPALVVRRTPAAAVAVVLRRRGRRLLARVPRAARGAARGGSAARKPGVGQLVDGGVGRSRTVEAYAVPLTCVSGLRGFRLLGIRRVLGRVAVLVAVGLRPVVLAAPVVETGERAGGRTRRR